MIRQERTAERGEQMLYATKAAFQKTDEERAESARMWLEMFNGSDADEWNDPSKFCLDLYNLCYAFADARTLLAKRPKSIPLKSELLLGFTLAKLNVLRRFPYLLNAQLVERSFAEMETLLEVSEGSKDQTLKSSSGNHRDALAITHFFQNTLHNFYLMQTRELLDFNRLFGQLRPPPPVYAHMPPPKYIH